MKLLFSEFWEPLALEEGEFASLVVEHPPTFRALVADLHGQICGGLPGECVLSEDGRPLELSRCAELFVEVVPFPGARRSLLTRAAAALERWAVAAEQYERTLSLLAQVERFLWELCDELPLTVDTQRLTVGGLLKLAELSVGPAEEGGLQTALDYMDLVARLERDKLFLFVNLRGYYACDELKRFFHAVRLHKHRVLMLEAREYPLLPGEKRVLIDADLCEIRL